MPNEREESGAEGIKSTQANPNAAGAHQWDVFISHASEDKQAVARPLAKLLETAGLKVWLDENELRLGDSLRQKIDHGLAHSHHGIVILSAAFFAKDWPQRELNGLATLENSTRKVILPVWHGVDHDYIARYSPMLADRFAANTRNGVERVAEDILRALNHAGSPGLAIRQSTPGAGRKATILIALAVLAAILLFWLARSFPGFQQLPAPGHVALAAVAKDIVRGAGSVVSLHEVAHAPSVLVFQEKHESLKGQIEIAVMLNRLYEGHWLRHLGEEGVFTADGVIDASWYHPALKSGQRLGPRPRVAVQMLAEGEISSGELMALVYADFAIHGLEKAVEYNVDLPAQDPVLKYLLAIAEASASPDHKNSAATLFRRGQSQAALASLLKSNDIAQREYAALYGKDSPGTEDIVAGMDRIEAEAKHVGASVSAGDARDFRQMKVFLSRVAPRSETMSENIASLAFARAEEPLAIIIGAEHTARVRRNLEAKGLSFAVISPLSLLDQKEDADLPDDAFARRSRGLSGDQAQALGAFLDGRKKPPPVVSQRVWFRSKIEAYLLTALIAGMPASGRLVLSDDIYRELLATQYVTLVPSTLGLMGRDRVFELRAQVQDLKAPVDVWVRTAMLGASKAVTLESALEECLAGIADLRPKKLPDGSVKVHVTPQAVAVFSTSSAVIHGLSLSN